MKMGTQQKNINDWTWGLIFFVCIGIILGIFYYCDIELGKSLSGIIGVAGSLGAMVVIALTLKEQQKENRRKDAIDSFDRMFLHFNDVLHGQSESDSNSTMKEYLQSLWDEGTRDNELAIKYMLNQIDTEINNETYKYVSDLEKVCDDKDLKKISNILMRLFDIKYSNDNIYSETSKLIDYYWKGIPVEIQKYAGFYWSWNKESNDGLLNEKITAFYINSKENHIDIQEKPLLIRIPENILRIKINEKGQQIGDWIDYSFEMEIASEYDLSIWKAELVSMNEETLIINNFSDDKSIYKISKRKKSIHNLPLLVLFPKIKDSRKKIEKFLNQEINLKLYIHYRDWDWIYKGRLQISENTNTNDKYSVAYGSYIEKKN